MPAEVREQLAAAKPQGFSVWPRNMPIVSAWIAVASQWRTATVGDGRLYWVGLDYVAAKAGLDLAGLVLDPREWAELRLMERAAGNQLNAALG